MNYSEYMLEHLEDSDLMFYTAFEEKVEIKANYYFQENLMPLIESALTPKGVDSLIDFVSRFLDDHFDQLNTAGPVYNITFTDKDSAFFYQMIGKSKDEILEMFDEMVAQTYSGENVNKVFRIYTTRVIPHILIFIAMLIWGINHQDNDVVECCQYLVVFSIYPILFRRYWKYRVRPDLMDYTIERLSNKNIIKKGDTVQDWLRHHGQTSVNNFRTRLVNPVPDGIYLDFALRVRSQINSALQVLSNAYYSNYAKDASQHITDSRYDDGNLVEQENQNAKAAYLAENIAIKMRSNQANQQFSNLVADAAKVSVDKMVNHINTILLHEESRLVKLIENILILFYKSKPLDDNLGSDVFLEFGLGLYKSISSSKDPLRKEITAIMDYWVHTILNLQQEYSTRPASVKAYRRALYNYMIYMIRYYK